MDKLDAGYLRVHIPCLFFLAVLRSFGFWPISPSPHLVQSRFSESFVKSGLCAIRLHKSKCCWSSLPRPQATKQSHVVCAIMLHKLGPCDAPDFSEIVWVPENHKGRRVPVCPFP